jgi:bifunctional polynucleotide phosphatase/kinase
MLPYLVVQLQELHESGYKIVIFTNQAIIKSALGGKAAAQFKAKMDEILAEIGVPATVYAATLKDDNRKPGVGMWTHFTQNSNGEKEVDMKSSYYVGDAAGRSDDFSGTDKEFAEAVGLPFKVPEDVFGESVPSLQLSNLVVNCFNTVNYLQEHPH